MKYLSLIIALTVLLPATLQAGSTDSNSKTFRHTARQLSDAEKEEIMRALEEAQAEVQRLSQEQQGFVAVQVGDKEIFKESFSR